MRKIAILAEGSFEWHDAKTAIGFIRYASDTTVAVIDSTRIGQDVAQALQAPIGAGIPMVANVEAALHYQPDALLIGIAPRGGSLPPAWRNELLTAMAAGLDIISGLHTFLADDAELRSAAEHYGVTLWDVRRPSETKRVASFAPHRTGSHTILLVGSDCATGKMTTALELDREARRRGFKSSFLATGQTGIMISGDGLPVDRLISDFTSGMVEEKVIEYTNRYDWVFVEGQGALNHPAYSPVTLGLLHGSLPDAMIFSHKVGEQTINGYPRNPLPSLQRLIQINEEAVSWLRPTPPSKVVGLALVTNHLSETEARSAIQQVQEETGLPATDPLRFGVGNLLNALIRYFATL